MARAPVLRSLLPTTGTAKRAVLPPPGTIIHSLTQGQHGKGREWWRKAGGAVKAGGERDSRCSIHVCCCPAALPPRAAGLALSALLRGTREAALPEPLLWAGFAVPCRAQTLPHTVCVVSARWSTASAVASVFPADLGSIRLEELGVTESWGRPGVLPLTLPQEPRGPLAKESRASQKKWP